MNVNKMKVFEMCMSLEYINTQSDIEEYLQYFESGDDVKKKKRLLLFRYEAFALLISVFGVMSEEPLSGLGAFVLLNVLYVAWFRKAIYKRFTKQSIANLENGLSLNQEKHLEINDSGIKCTKDHEELGLDWNVIDRVVENNGSFYMYEGSMLRVLLPRSAFKQSSDVADFKAKLKKRGVQKRRGQE
jgi:hypothetical protein